MDETILIIDDDQSNRTRLADCLEAEGYEVQTAEDGVDGCHQITAQCPDLIVMEALLPQRDGFELCNWLKSEPFYASTPVILLTSIHLTEDQKINGMNVGGKRFVFRADCIMNKPVRPEDLSCEVAKLLGTHSTAPPPEEMDRVLVIDRDQETVDLITQWLAENKYPVSSAGTSAEGVEETFAQMPDLVLLAMVMGEHNTIDVVKELRSCHGDEMVIVMMAALEEGLLVAEAMKAGANDYIRKPVDFAQITNLLLHDLQDHQMELIRRKLMKQLKSTSADLMRKVDELRAERRRAKRAHRFAQAIISGLGDQLELIRGDKVGQYVAQANTPPPCCARLETAHACVDCPVPAAYHTGQAGFVEVTGDNGVSLACSATPVVDPKGRRVVVRMIREIVRRTPNGTDATAESVAQSNTSGSGDELQTNSASNRTSPSHSAAEDD